MSDVIHCRPVWDINDRLGAIGLRFSEWNKYSFKDITINFDKSRVPLSSKEREHMQGDYPYYGAQGIIDYIDDYIFDGTYLLIAEDGENLNSKRQNIAQLVHGKFWLNNHAHIVTNNQLSDIRYLCYLFNSTDVSGYITGSAQPKLSQSSLNSIEFVLPKVETQKAIADTLSCLDDKIELNNKINANLEQTAQAIFKSWFVDFEPFQDGEFVESELGRIPKGWQYNSVQNLMNVIYGAPFSSSLFNETKEGYPLIRIRDLKTFNPQYYTDENHPNLELVQSGDIIFGMDAEFRPCIWQGKTGVLNQRVCKVTSNHKSVCDFFIYFVLKPHLDFIEYYKVGTTVSHIGKSDIDKINIVIPPYSILEQYKDIVEPMYKQLLINSQENIIISELRNSLLPKLMSGEIDVSQV